MKTAGVFIIPKIPEISVEVKWKIHFGCFWSEYLGLPSIGLPKFAFPFLTNRFTALEKELKLLESDSLWLARFDRKFLGYSHIWSTPRIINAIFGHYACFWDSQTEARGSRLAARKQRLAARGSRLAARGSRVGLAGSQNSLPQLLMSLRKIQSNHITFIFIALIDPLFLTMLIGQKTIITI